MSAITRRRNAVKKTQTNQEPKKEETKTMSTLGSKQPKKRNAPRKIVDEIETRGVVAPVILWEVDLPNKAGEIETKTFATFAQATEALKVAKLASKTWPAERIVSKMIGRISKFEAGKHYPNNGQAGQAFETMRRTMMVFVETCQAKKEDDDERAS